MKKFLAKELSTKEQYKLLIGSVIPRPIALVATQSSEKIVNLAPFSFFNIVSYDPAIVSISIQRMNGEMKDTARNITEQGEAVVHIVDTHNVEKANIASVSLPYNESELTMIDTELANSTEIKTPGIRDAKVRFETKLYHHEVIINDQGMPTADLILLRVVAFHISNEVYQNGYVIEEALNAVSRLAGNDYANIGNKFQLIRPTVGKGN